MNPAPSPRVPSMEPWPTWTVGCLISSGLVMLLVDTESVLGLFGALLIGVGMYGIARRWRGTRTG